MSSFQIELTSDDNGTFLVTVPALPEVTTFGETREDAYKNASSAIEEALAARINGGQDVPFPGDGRVALYEHGRILEFPFVRIAPLVQAKLSLYGMLRSNGVTRAELARKLNWHREQVDRLFRLDHPSRLDQLEKAFEVFGFHINLEVALA